MSRLLLYKPDELDPLRERYVKILLHAAITGEPPAPSPMDAGLALCDVLAGREPRGPGGEWPNVHQTLHRMSQHQPVAARLWIYARAMAGWIGDNDLDQGGRDLLFAGGNLTLPHPLHDEDAWDTRNTEYLPAMLWEWLWMFPVLTRVSPQNALNDAGVMGNARQLDRRQQASGALLQQQPGDSPDRYWLNELIALHALTSYALISNQTFAIESVKRAALFHHCETQPDHATSQPWGIHAFLLDAETIPTADLMLLAAGVNRPEGLDAVSRILLADAAVCLMAKPFREQRS